MIVIQTFRNIFNHLFSFIEYEESTARLTFLRISIGLMGILKFLVYGNDFLNFHGQYAVVSWTISKASIYDFLPHLGDLAVSLSNYTGQNLNDASMTIFTAYIVFCIFLIVGFLTRLSSIMCFWIHLALIYAGSGLMYGVDVFTQISLFYCMFFPLGSRYSVDNLIGITKMKKRSIEAGILVRLIQIQLCLIYLSTGIEKSMGSQWWDGEAIWRTLMLPTFRHFDFTWLSHFPIFTKLLCWSTLFFETLYCVSVWIPKIRTLHLLAIMTMHLFIGLFMGMWLFGLIMIVLNLFAFGKEILVDVKSFLPKLSHHAN